MATASATQTNVAFSRMRAPPMMREPSALNTASARFSTVATRPNAATVSRWSSVKGTQQQRLNTQNHQCGGPQ